MNAGTEVGTVPPAVVSPTVVATAATSAPLTEGTRVRISESVHV